MNKVSKNIPRYIFEPQRSHAARSTLFPFLFSKCDERCFLKVINYK